MLHMKNVVKQKLDKSHGGLFWDIAAVWINKNAFQNALKKWNNEDPMS